MYYPPWISPWTPKWQNHENESKFLLLLFFFQHSVQSLTVPKLEFVTSDSIFILAFSNSIQVVHRTTVIFLFFGAFLRFVFTLWPIYWLLCAFYDWLILIKSSSWHENIDTLTWRWKGYSCSLEIRHFSLFPCFSCSAHFNTELMSNIRSLNPCSVSILTSHLVLMDTSFSRNYKCTLFTTFSVIANYFIGIEFK